MCVRELVVFYWISFLTDSEVYIFILARRELSTRLRERERESEWNGRIRQRREFTHLSCAGRNLTLTHVGSVIDFIITIIIFVRYFSSIYIHTIVVVLCASYHRKHHNNISILFFFGVCVNIVVVVFRLFLKSIVWNSRYSIFFRVCYLFFPVYEFLHLFFLRLSWHLLQKGKKRIIPIEIGVWCVYIL